MNNDSPTNCLGCEKLNYIEELVKSRLKFDAERQFILEENWVEVKNDIIDIKKSLTKNQDSRELLIELTTELNCYFKPKLEEIHTAQKFTNGKVKGLLIWRGFVTGSLFIIVGTVIPLLIYIYNNNLK